MLNKLFKKPLELEIGNQTLQFNSVSDVSFCLEGRTSVSSTKLAELYKHSISELQEQAQKLGEINKKMFVILNDVVDDPGNVERSLRELDTQMFSQDQNWREIIQALNKEESEINDIRVTVVMKYMKYVTALEETITQILIGKRKAEGVTAKVEPEEVVDFGATWAVTSFQNEITSPPQQPQDEFKRLPKEKGVTVKIPSSGRLDVRLASYPCQLVSEDGKVQFIDNNHATILSKGRNVVGRSLKSTVKIDPAKRHVSRTHLVIILNEGDALQLTDHSSEGTFIKSSALN